MFSLYPVSSSISSHIQKCACRQIGYFKLPRGVNECAEVCVHPMQVVPWIRSGSTTALIRVDQVLMMNE